ncbi:hypothetical protein LTR22_020636 [Elasticomyces elasticus]|nr:hypothetical protein LTR22_020636 [Elasticomyces elasticus]KAK4927791.1 hypothetical protein LTR49_005417 [Elasticomyces elasticus]KAK5761462.1 hypothetical protein LTS12_008425 [Elasticomyces elasticus]
MAQTTSNELLLKRRQVADRLFEGPDPVRSKPLLIGDAGERLWGVVELREHIFSYLPYEANLRLLRVCKDVGYTLRTSPALRRSLLLDIDQNNTIVSPALQLLYTYDDRSRAYFRANLTCWLVHCAHLDDSFPSAAGVQTLGRVEIRFESVHWRKRILTGTNKSVHKPISTDSSLLRTTYISTAPTDLFVEVYYVMDDQPMKVTLGQPDSHRLANGVITFGEMIEAVEIAIWREEGTRTVGKKELRRYKRRHPYER